MLDIKRITENPQAVKDALSARGGNFPVDEAIDLDSRRKEIILQVENLKAVRNSESQNIAVLLKQKQDVESQKAQVKQLGDQIKQLDAELAEVEEKLLAVMHSIPNIPHHSVVKGKDDTQNKVISVAGTPKKFDYQPKAHWDIGVDLKILDFERAAKVTGARFTVYKGIAAKLERAVANFMLNLHTKDGYTEMLPPFLANTASMTGTGQLPKFAEDMFAISGTDYFLIPTAEVPVTNYHRNEILEAEMLPIWYTGYSACFRAEAGSAGRDTRGLIRQHQFNKVELVKFCHPDTSYDELEQLTEQAEKVLVQLELPYRKVLLCTGDMGFNSAKTYDLEVWMPSYNRYVEISSCSNFEDFQARRANIKFKEGNQKARFVHTLNGSGLAIGRTVAAIMENYQNPDGTFDIPKVLKPYFEL